MFNDATSTLSSVYYPTIKLFIIEALNIVGLLDECMSQELKLKACIDVMKSKWLDYYANIPIIYLLRLIFDLCWKLDSLIMCLENYYNFLDLEVDVHSIVSNIKSIFFHYMINMLNFMVQILILMFNKMSFKLNLLHQLELVRDINCYFKKKMMFLINTKLEL